MSGNSNAHYLLHGIFENFDTILRSIEPKDEPKSEPKSERKNEPKDEPQNEPI